jgi:Pyruvate/2-oxoacid:ferredoxin oxidoreductase delta subunit
MIMNDSPYVAIAANINKTAWRAPRSLSSDGFSDAFLEYLKILYTPEEAAVARYLKVIKDIFSTTIEPASFMTATQLAKISGVPKNEVNQVLQQMSDKNVVINMRKIIKASSITWPVRTVAVLWKTYSGEGLKEIARILAIFFTSTLESVRRYGIKSGMEFISMRVYAFPHISLLKNLQNFHDQRSPEIMKGAELYKEFFIKDKFYKFYETGAKGTPLYRTIPVARTIDAEQKILDTEEAHRIIEAAASATLVPCPCRERTEKLGIRECKERNPIGSCIMLGLMGQAMEGMGLGRSVTKKQAKDYLDSMMEMGLVAATENSEENTSRVICMCCECCCSEVRGRTRWDNPTAVAPSNYLPKSNRTICTFCGKCAERCLFHAISVDKDNKRWKLKPELCIGCGVCSVGCEQSAVKLHRVERNQPFKTPQDLYRQIDMENR